jgi:Fungal specific transcription factor domain/Fungal Zn(2)-Cys(6) binuclear cluster domain
MESVSRFERDPPAHDIETSQMPQAPSQPTASTVKGKARSRDKDINVATKRRCVSTACIACRKRKSKCDGQLPKCAACASVYLTECEYAPHTDHRRKGVYKKDIDSLKTRNSTLQTLIHAILNYDEEDVPELVRQIRTCENLEDLAESIVAKAHGAVDQDEPPDSPVYGASVPPDVPQFEAELSGKMGDLLLEGSIKFIGGTSNLIWLPNDSEINETAWPSSSTRIVRSGEEAILSWTSTTQDKELILDLINMYFCWHYAYFTTLSKELFYRDFLQGRPTQYCSSLLVNVMLSLGCHFTTRPEARSNPDDSATAGDHFFKEAKRLMHENDEFAVARLCTVQALALMSVREAGCGREGKGWVYSGMSFRMAMDLGLNVDAPGLSQDSTLGAEDIDARRITFWGCFLFDKWVHVTLCFETVLMPSRCWSNYLGRQPQLPLSSITTLKPDVFPSEDAEIWSPYTDSGITKSHSQPARTRAVALQISKLSEISSDLLISFYHPTQLEKPASKQAELKKLSDLHTRLEAWKKELPQEMEPRDGQLPQVLLMQ